MEDNIEIYTESNVGGGVIWFIIELLLRISFDCGEVIKIYFLDSSWLV